MAPSQSSMSNAIMAGVAGISLGLLVGLWQGSSQADERFTRWLMVADLPAGCWRLLDRAAADLNAEDESRAGGEIDRP